MAALLFPLPSFLKLYGPLGISSFALCGIAGAFGGRLLVHRLQRGSVLEKLQAVEAALTPLFVGALIGARLFNQVAVADLVWYNPLSWIRVTGNSLSFTGGLVGAVAAVWWAGRRRGDSLAVLDALAPGAALALAAGWLGVPAVGRITQLPWALPVAAGFGVQPVQPYGFAGFAAIAAALSWQASRLEFAGQNLASFVLLTAAFRFLLGFAEQAPRFFGPWSLAQVGDAATVLAGLALLAWLRRDRGTVPAASGEGGGA